MRCLIIIDRFAYGFMVRLFHMQWALFMRIRCQDTSSKEEVNSERRHENLAESCIWYQPL